MSNVLIVKYDNLNSIVLNGSSIFELYVVGAESVLKIIWSHAIVFENTGSILCAFYVQHN